MTVHLVHEVLIIFVHAITNKMRNFVIKSKSGGGANGKLGGKPCGYLVQWFFEFKNHRKLSSFNTVLPRSS